MLPCGADHGSEAPARLQQSAQVSIHGNGSLMSEGPPSVEDFIGYEADGSPRDRRQPPPWVVNNDH